MKYRLWLAAFLLPAAVQAGHAPEQAASAETASQAIAAAEAAVKRADGVGFAWRDSESMIAEARQAALKQDYAGAERLAAIARRQGELAYRQYQDQNAAKKR